MLDVGVIHEPSTGETFHGRRGGGAFLNGRPIRASAATDLTEGSVGTGFSNRRDPHNVARLIDLILDEGGVFFRNASGALMLAYVASGRLLAYVEEHMNAWDCLAGMLLVEEAGGRIVHAGSEDRPAERHHGHRRRQRRVRPGAGALREIVRRLKRDRDHALISTGPRSGKPRPTDCPAAKGASTSGDTTKTSPNSVPTTNSRWLPT